MDESALSASNIRQGHAELCTKKKEEIKSKWQAILGNFFGNMMAVHHQNMKFSPMILRKSLLDLTWPGNSIGVITSGGDSQGMNAAVRAITRMGLYLGCKVFYIKEGYQGLIEGGDNIEEATMMSTSNIIHVGGTMIGSARCMEFKQRSGRLKAAKNLILREINSLIVIGGDGSLTGANLFRQEWPSLLRELVDTDAVSPHLTRKVGHLNLVGIVGSIDNDFCGTDITLGADSALHRILGSIEDILTTAVSHKRAFVLEIMGRQCGYLPLLAGLASEASAIFIPENPPPGDWRQYLVEQLKEKSKAGEIRRTHIVLVAEGAMDRNGQPIKSSEVQKVLSERLNMDTRVTVLGHVQRGGITSAFDRILGSRQGVDAVLALMEATRTSPSVVIGLQYNAIVRVPLIEAVERTKQVTKYLEAGEFDMTVKLRGHSISSNLYVQGILNQVINHPRLQSQRKKALRMAMVHVGYPASGMNAVARAFVITCLTYGYQPVFIYNSWYGLLDDQVQVMNRNDVHLWTGHGGTLLGTGLCTLDEVGAQSITRKIVEHKISGLVIVGGFEAFQSACELRKRREIYEELNIPTIVIPATASNNVPGMDMSLGCDTALNQICKTCDSLKSSASSLNECVYVVEVGGGNCGYLTTMAGIATGADRAFIMEQPFSVKDLKMTCEMLKHKLEYTGVRYGVILRSENANKNLTTDFIYRLLNEEGKPQFYARKSVLGDTEKGYKPSPYDRIKGLMMGVRSTLWLLQCVEENGGLDGPVHTTNDDSLVVSCMQSGRWSFTPVEELIPQTDFVNCIPDKKWWLDLMPLFHIFSPDKFE